MAERGQAADEMGWDRFRDIDHLANHWKRPIGPPSFYWYLTFGASTELQAITEKYQEAIAFPYYDPVPLQSLHLTLDRVAFDGVIDVQTLNAFEVAAARECKKLEPFKIGIRSASGTPGAIGFKVHPEHPIRILRDRLRVATLSVNPLAPVKGPEFDAHIAIAYCNADGVSAAETIEAIEFLGPMTPVEVAVSEVSLVLLERRAKSYEWQTVSRIPLLGNRQTAKFRG